MNAQKKSTRTVSLRRKYLLEPNWLEPKFGSGRSSRRAPGSNLSSITLRQQQLLQLETRRNARATRRQQPRAQTKERTPRATQREPASISEGFP